MYVKPAPGLTIRDPDLFDFLPADGRSVPETEYWSRRVRDGDVALAVEPISVAATAAEAKPIQKGVDNDRTI